MLGPVEHDDSDHRAELLKRLQTTHAVGALEGAQFMLGARLRLVRGLSRDAADAAVGELAWLGARAEVQAHRDDDGEMLALDQVSDAGPESGWSPVGGGAAPMLAALDEPDAPSPPATPPAVPPPAATVTAPSPAVAAVAVAAVAVAPSPVMTPPTADDARFRPRSDDDVAMDLQMEAPRVLPPIRDAAPSPEGTPDDDAAAPVDEEPARVRGRLFDGKLRDNPGARIGVGLVLALGLGYVMAQPYARRASRQVAEIRAEADQERYLAAPEAQAHVRALDRQAEDAASSGAFGIGLIWLGAAGAIFAGWWRAT